MKASKKHSKPQARGRSLHSVVRLYLAHLSANWFVAAKALVLAAFHFAHGVIPFRWTEHDRFGINLNKSNPRLGQP